MHAPCRMYTDVHPASPAVRSRTRRAGCPEGATDRGRLLFGYFLLARQEKVTRSAKGGVEALALRKQRKNWIPACAGMTSIRIPACAGLRRQDAGANIRAANGPKGELRMQRVMTK